MTNEVQINSLVENALDYLKRANEEFDSHPKYSVLHFYTAVELFLKARLMSEHWTLIVARQKDLSRDKFDKGDFISVSLAEACERLDKVLRSPITKNEFIAFERLRKHRNQIVHFFHAATTDEDRSIEIVKILGEQLRAWYYLHKLLTEKWRKVFSPWERKLDEVAVGVKTRRGFFRPRYEEMRPELETAKAEGNVFTYCPSCGFESLEENGQLGKLYEGHCWVCDFLAGFLIIICEQCGRPVSFIGDGFKRCECGKYYEPEDIVRILDERHYDKHDPDTWQTPHCTACEQLNTVMQHEGQLICASCFCEWESDEIESCDWCSALNAGDMSDSNMNGCVECDGSFGHLMGRDD